MYLSRNQIFDLYKSIQLESDQFLMEALEDKIPMLLPMIPLGYYAGFYIEDDGDKRDFINWVADKFDPSPNSLYITWILNLFKKGVLQNDEHAQFIKDSLEMYTELKRKPAFPAEYRDINKFKTLEEFDDVIEQYSNITSKKERFRLSRETGIKLLEDSPPYKLYVVTTPEAAAKHFRGLDWCVKDPSFFNSPRYNPPIFYYFTYNDKPYTLIHLDHQECHDVKNKPVDLTEDQIEIMTSENVKEDIESRDFSKKAMDFYNFIIGDIEHAVDTLRSELDETRDRYLDGDHIQAYYDIFDDEIQTPSDIQFQIYGTLKIDLDEAFETDDRFPNYVDEYKIQTDSEISEFASYIANSEQLNEKVTDVLKKIEYISNESSNAIIFTIKYKDHYSNDIDDFKTFIEDYMNVLEEHYLDIKSVVQLALAHAGFVEGEEVDSYVEKYQPIEDPDEFLESLTHVTFDADDNTIDMNFKNINVRSRTRFPEIDIDKLGNYMGMFLTNYLKLNYKPIDRSNIQERAAIFYNDDLEVFGIHKITMTYFSFESGFNLSMYLYVDALNQNSSQIMEFLDHYYRDLHHAAELAFYKTIEDSSEFYLDKGYFNRLDHVYSKYMRGSPKISI